MFLSCRPSVVITTLSTGLVDVEVTSETEADCDTDHYLVVATIGERLQ